MLAALMSDAHDARENLLEAVRRAESAGCCHLLYMGDLSTVETLRLLRQEWKGQMDLVPGNNDYPRAAFLECVRDWDDTRYHADTAHIEVGGRRVLMTHIPGAALQLAAESGQYDAIFFGHTHKPVCTRVGATLVANPGDIQGRFGAPSFGLYDTAENTVKIISL